MVLSSLIKKITTSFQLGFLCILSGCSPTFVGEKNSLLEDPTLQNDHFITQDGSKLPYRSWQPSGSLDHIMIAVHGFNDYSNFIHGAAQYFNQQNIGVYSYDQRGFGGTTIRGGWSNTQTLARDLATFTSLIKRQHPDTPIYILGNSMGGAVTIITMTMYSLSEVEGVILVAPAVWARSKMPFYQRMILWIAAHTIPWKTVTGESLNITPSDNTEMLKALTRDPLVIKKTRIEAIYGLSHLMDEAFASAEKFTTDCLLLYGGKDEIIPKSPIMDFHARLPFTGSGKQRFIFYDNGYHMLLRSHKSEKVMEDMVDWLRNRIPPISESPVTLQRKTL